MESSKISVGSGTRLRVGNMDIGIRNLKAASDVPYSSESKQMMRRKKEDEQYTKHF